MLYHVVTYFEVESGMVSPTISIWPWMGRPKVWPDPLKKTPKKSYENKSHWKQIWLEVKSKIMMVYDRKNTQYI